MTKIYYTKPSITQLEIDYAADAVMYGWGENCYDYIDRFEKKFCEYLGTDYAIATSSCTGALHLGLAGLGLGPGDEVILADINWVATVAPIKYLGATPVFVDVKKDSWCIDPESVERAISSKTKVIIATHIYGNLCDLNRLKQIADNYKIVLIEDAAEAIGSIYKGQTAGSYGKFGVFSFHGSKTLTTGEGGMFVTKDPQLYEKVLSLSNHGRNRFEKRQFWPEAIGYKYKMSNVQAAIGCGQIERIEELIRRKREIFYSYMNFLSRDISPIYMNIESPGDFNGYWMPTIIMPEHCDRDVLLSLLLNENIDGRVFFWPLSLIFGNGKVVENPVSFSLYKRGINLPSYHDMTDEQIKKVARIITDYFKVSQ